MRIECAIVHGRGFRIRVDKVSDHFLEALVRFVFGGSHSERCKRDIPSFLFERRRRHHRHRRKQIASRSEATGDQVVDQVFRTSRLGSVGRVLIRVFRRVIANVLPTHVELYAPPVIRRRRRRRRSVFRFNLSRSFSRQSFGETHGRYRPRRAGSKRIETGIGGVFFPETAQPARRIRIVTGSAIFQRYQGVQPEWV